MKRVWGAVIAIGSA